MLICVSSTYYSTKVMLRRIWYPRPADVCYAAVFKNVIMAKLCSILKFYAKVPLYIAEFMLCGQIISGRSTYYNQSLLVSQKN